MNTIFTCTKINGTFSSKAQVVMVIAHQMRKEGAQTFKCSPSKILFSECLKMAWAVSKKFVKCIKATEPRSLDEKIVKCFIRYESRQVFYRYWDGSFISDTINRVGTGYAWTEKQAAHIERIFAIDPEYYDMSTPDGQMGQWHADQMRREVRYSVKLD